MRRIHVVVQVQAKVLLKLSPEKAVFSAQSTWEGKLCHAAGRIAFADGIASVRI